MPTSLDLSVVIPVYNEEESILPLAQALHDVLVQLGRSFEVIFVDDGSSDGTAVRLEQILRIDRRVRVIQLTSNCGQTAALCAGFDHARGRYIVALDADLQNDPADIPRILAEMDRGYDVVSGWRRNRRDHWLSRRLPSQAANAILSWVSGTRLHDFGCTLKGYRAEFLRRVPMYSDMHRYLPAFARAMGARVLEIEVRHHPRRFGISKYGISRIYRVLTDILLLQMLVHFAIRPLHWFGIVSVLVFLFSAGVLVAAAGLAGDGEGHFQTIVIPGITGLGVYLGTTLFSLGFLCELVNRVAEGGMEPLATVDEAGRVAP